MNTDNYKTLSQHCFNDYVYIEVGNVLLLSVIINSQLAECVVVRPPCCMVRTSKLLANQQQSGHGTTDSAS